MDFTSSMGPCLPSPITEFCWSIKLFGILLGFGKIGLWSLNLLGSGARIEPGLQRGSPAENDGVILLGLEDTIGTIITPPPFFNDCNNKLLHYICKYTTIVTNINSFFNHYQKNNWFFCQHHYFHTLLSLHEIK